MSEAVAPPSYATPPSGGRPRAFDEQLKALRQDVRNVALPGLAATYLGIAVLLAAPAFGPWWLPLVTAVPMGLLQYRVVLSGHEAVHKTLCRPLWLNEALGVVGQAIVGVNFASYRVQHLEHHRSTSVQDDPDGHIYGPIIAAPRGWRRWATWFFGTFLEIAIKVWQKGVGSVGTKQAAKLTKESAAASRRHTAYVILAQSSILALCWAVTGHVWGYFLVWILPLFFVAVLVNRTRILVEHGLALLTDTEHAAHAVEASRDRASDARIAGAPDDTRSTSGVGREAAAARRLPTIDMDVPAWERWVFAPFLFNHHCCHHLQPAVPHHHLPALRALLERHGAPGFRVVRGSYVSALREAMRS